MFTGIVTSIGEVLNFQKNDSKNKLIIKFKDLDSDIILGESIAVNGVCLTVVDIIRDKKALCFDVSDETMDCTSFKNLKPADYVNIERALQVNSRLSGHLVSGHVDSVCKIINIEKSNDSFIYNFEIFEKDFMKFIAKKGSICLDGISLTVNGTDNNSFWVTIIPHTIKHTNFQYKKINDIVNFEVDLIARYVNNFQTQKILINSI